jgi:hypothetical protein
VIKEFVDYLSTYVDDASAEWFEGYWPSPRHKYYLYPAGYAGSNNNIGIEVDWRDIKLQCPASSAFSTFLDVLWEFIKQLGMEHQVFLEHLCYPDS